MKHWQGWIPIIYSSVMVVTGIISLFFWDKGGRCILVAGFLIGVVIGTLGVWFHSEGKPISAVHQVLTVVLSEPGRILADVGGPPVLAPLSLAGLGAIGAILCLATFAPVKDRKE